MIKLDFETRSEADIKKVGTYEYARHPSTEIMCLAHLFDDEPEVRLWHPGFRDLSYLQCVKKADRTEDDIPPALFPAELCDRVHAGELVEAHGSWFERCIWHFQLAEKLGWPAVAHGQWRCSAAHAASFSLRRALEHVAADLGLAQQKDAEGHRLMLKLSKPRKPTKGDPDSKWHQKAPELLRLFDYCKQDVRTEDAISNFLPPMPQVEIDTWLLDQKINWRGIHCDRALVDGALSVGAGAEEAAQEELCNITYGLVEKATQKVQFLDWLEGEGVKVPTKLNAKKKLIRTTEAAGLEKLLEGELIEHVRRAVEVWLAVAKTSVRKYTTFDRHMADDDRVRGTMLYYGATTGRWSGRGPQPHNMPRNVPKGFEQIVEDVSTGDYDLVAVLYGEDEVQGTLKSIARGIITAAPGHILMVVDLGQIEARGTFWVSGHNAGLDAFRKADAGLGPDIYCWQAEQIFGYKVTKDMDERQAGKVVVLGCGYQMGAGKLVTYAEGLGVTLSEEQAVRAVKGYRKANWPVKDFWDEANRCAIEAVDTGRVVEQNEHIRWGVRGRFLHCRLPSGRMLAYLDPAVDWGEAPWGEKIRKLYFSGTNTYTRKWERTDTYGGKLTENIVQALCRDIMRDGMLRADAAGYPLILTVHDEIVAETKTNFGSLDEYKELVIQQPKWAPKFPIVADGYRKDRYKK